MNPGLPQAEIDREMERDPANASAEYMVQFRTDIAAFVDPAIVEHAVARGVRFALRSPVLTTSRSSIQAAARRTR